MGVRSRCSIWPRCSFLSTSRMPAISRRAAASVNPFPRGADGSQVPVERVLEREAIEHRPVGPHQWETGRHLDGARVFVQQLAEVRLPQPAVHPCADLHAEHVWRQRRTAQLPGEVHLSEAPLPEHPLDPVPKRGLRTDNHFRPGLEQVGAAIRSGPDPPASSWWSHASGASPACFCAFSANSMTRNTCACGIDVSVRFSTSSTSRSPYGSAVSSCRCSAFPSDRRGTGGCRPAAPRCRCSCAPRCSRRCRARSAGCRPRSQAIGREPVHADVAAAPVAAHHHVTEVLEARVLGWFTLRTCEATTSASSIR